MIKRYNGTAWNAVTYCKNFNGTEQFTYFPVVANTFANAISSWTIKGNEQHTGTPAPGNPIRGVGEETANLFNPNGIKTVYNQQIYQYTITGLTPNAQYTCSSNFIADRDKAASIYFNGTSSYSASVSYGYDITSTANANGEVYVLVRYEASTNTNPAVYDDIINGTIWVMLNEGSTALPYETFGYKIPISSGNATTPVYISAPLRKSLDGTVFDTLDSTGLVTYNVDEYGAPLVTPTTATVTVPTITSALGRTVISFGTTIQPSEFDMTYHGWHSHIPSIRSNNAWS